MNCSRLYVLRNLVIIFAHFAIEMRTSTTHSLWVSISLSRRVISCAITNESPYVSHLDICLAITLCQHDFNFFCRLSYNQNPKLNNIITDVECAFFTSLLLLSFFLANNSVCVCVSHSPLHICNVPKSRSARWYVDEIGWCTGRKSLHRMRGSWWLGNAEINKCSNCTHKSCSTLFRTNQKRLASGLFVTPFKWAILLCAHDICIPLFTWKTAIGKHFSEQQYRFEISFAYPINRRWHGVVPFFPCWLDWLGQSQVKLSIYYTFAYFIRAYLVNQQMQMTRRKRFAFSMISINLLCEHARKLQRFRKSNRAAQRFGRICFWSFTVGGPFIFFFAVVTPNVSEVCHRLNEDHALWTVCKWKWKQMWKMRRIFLN